MSKKQKKDKAARSTRQLMGIEEIKDYCIATRMGNLVFFIIKPTNISVLPVERMDGGEVTFKVLVFHIIIVFIR